jgi:hypothetical protein
MSFSAERVVSWTCVVQKEVDGVWERVRLTILGAVPGHDLRYATPFILRELWTTTHTQLRGHEQRVSRLLLHPISPQYHGVLDVRNSSLLSTHRSVRNSACPNAPAA